MQTVSEQFEQLKGTFEVDLGIIHHFSSGVYAKQMHLPAGFTALSHKHEYDHLSLLAKGKVIVKTDEDTKEYTGPVCLTIRKGLNHSIHALEDSVWFCIHATEETDPEKVDEVLIKKVEV
jgi:quercetin dioxygenase-like cupin family protein